MKVTHLIVTGLTLLFTSLQCPAQQATPPAPPGSISTLPPFATSATSGPLSCAYCDLRGMDLSGKNLTNANLVGSDLREAKLGGATLDGAILIGANLAGADLSGAHLSSASNGPADLTNANLVGAKLDQAVLTGADLTDAALEGADFSGANLTGAVLGPHPKVGTEGERRTSFRDARMDRRFGLAAMAADLSGVIWNEPQMQATALGPAGVTCGNSNLAAVTNPVYVSTQGTDSGNCGAGPATACQSLAHALTRCTPKNCDLLAMFGEYVLPATLAFDSHTTPTGARLYGGCVAQEQSGADWRSVIEAPPRGLPALSVTGVKPVVLENFKILGTRAAAGDGAPAVTVQVAQTSQVTFDNSIIVGGQGGKGRDGASQPAGANGGPPNEYYGGSNASCPNSNGGNGSWGFVSNGYRDPDCGMGPSFSGQKGQPGNTSKTAWGGGQGTPYAAGCIDKKAGDGGGGDGGANASCGTGGRASTDIRGSFAGASWSPAAGGPGTPGGNAGGGGGGGAGGGYCYSCIASKGGYSSGYGGGGGAGGCGGQAAPGGQQGGASFAIVAAAGSVLILNRSRVVAGRSGAGGNGGVGGNGGDGGAGGGGVTNSEEAGKGGNGGAGGVGGGGGGGAGGNGGPSVAVALVGGAKLEGAGIVYYNGSSGDFGGGGAGGTSPLCNTGPGGVSGVLGLVAETTTYP